MTSLFSLLQKTAQRHGPSGAVYSGFELRQTWGDLRHEALCLAASLASRGSPGDRVLVAARNQPQLVSLMFGVWAAGRVLAPLNVKLHVREMIAVIEDAEPEWIFADSGIATKLAEIGLPRERVIPIDSTAYDTLLSRAPALPLDLDAGALAWLFYTSGTTGRSKGAMLSHRNLMAMTLAHLADFEDLCPSHSILHAAPMSHGSGLYVLPYVARGARQVIPASRGFDPAELIELCGSHPGCGAFLTPTMVQRLRSECERCGAPPRGLRSIIFGGGPSFVQDLQRSIAYFGPILRHLYGQGEAPMTITGLAAHDLAAAPTALLSCVGWPRSGVEVKVVDADDRELPPGELGEIVCRGDVVMAGYWKNPSASAEALRNGWLHTGDLGSFDDRGCLTLRDRSKEVIISGGINIYPREVEQVLRAHPGVRDAAVLGLTDEEWGEIVVAFVVPVAGSSLDPDELDAHCLSQIARFKRPRRYFVLDELPVTGYGKVAKRELRDRLAALRQT